MFYSPLRYPGGKNRLAKFISKICVSNNIEGQYVEPFAGGASVALYLLFENKVKKITINDFDRSIYAFWYSVLYRTKGLCDLIESTEINLNTWKTQKKIQDKKKYCNLLELGFSTLFLNRTNFSGIITGGPIGGYEQKGKNKLNCRFNKETIIDRIMNISKEKKRISLFNLDALDLISKIETKNEKNSNVIYYFDPPYYLKGSLLYLNSYNDEDHNKLSKAIEQIQNASWIVSYDNVEKIKNIYSWVNKKKFFNLKHFVNKPKYGKEVLFFKNSLIVTKNILTNK